MKLLSFTRKCPVIERITTIPVKGIIPKIPARGIIPKIPVTEKKYEILSKEKFLSKEHSCHRKN